MKIKKKKETVRGGDGGRALRTLGDDKAYQCTNQILLHLPRQQKIYIVTCTCNVN